ncbi:hypothetical protein HAX54_049045 [Datura stramonium]|uniref:Uncharacterized protein n=1 Tax=Datura stramonium TaxID=4076 RepID=A0ABS8WM97_DATST|nr:hypothetical protein [Datura stramonium]
MLKLALQVIVQFSLHPLVPYSSKLQHLKHYASTHESVGVLPSSLFFLSCVLFAMPSPSLLTSCSRILLPICHGDDFLNRLRSGLSSFGSSITRVASASNNAKILAFKVDMSARAYTNSGETEAGGLVTGGTNEIRVVEGSVALSATVAEDSASGVAPSLDVGSTTVMHMNSEMDFTSFMDYWVDCGGGGTHGFFNGVLILLASFNFRRGGGNKKEEETTRPS